MILAVLAHSLAHVHTHHTLTYAHRTHTPHTAYRRYQSSESPSDVHCLYSSSARALSGADAPDFLRSVLTSLHAPARGREVGGRAAVAWRVGGAGVQARWTRARWGWRACLLHLLRRALQTLQAVEQPPHHGLVERRGGGEHAFELRHQLLKAEARQGRGWHHQRRRPGRRGRGWCLHRLRCGGRRASRRCWRFTRSRARWRWRLRRWRLLRGRLRRWRWRRGGLCQQQLRRLQPRQPRVGLAVAGLGHGV